MIVTVASYKGGQGKTTTAVHLAAILNEIRPTILVDCDPNRSASKWAARRGFPFPVVDERRALKVARNYQDMVIDTRAHPGVSDMRELAEGCDCLVIPMTPDAMAIDTLDELRAVLRMGGGEGKYRILQTIVPPVSARLRLMMEEALKAESVPMFTGYIRRYVAFQKAALEGTLVRETQDPHAADAWADYVEMCKELDF